MVSTMIRSASSFFGTQSTTMLRWTGETGLYREAGTARWVTVPEKSGCSKSM
jgi:hypothetical protein